MTVFVVQKQMRFDHNKGDLVPRFATINKAKRWGDLSYLLSPTASPFHSEPIIEELTKKLAKFCDEDRLVLIGNPVLIGMASSVASRSNSGRVVFLQWSGKDNDYLEIKTDMSILAAR